MSNGAQVDWFQQNAPQAAPQQPQGGDWFEQNTPSNKTPGQRSTWRTALDYTGLPGAEQILEGIGAGALQTVGGIGSGINKIAGDSVVPPEGLAALRTIATPQNTLQRIGSMGEQGAELAAAGPEKTMGLVSKLLLGAGTGGASVAAHQAGSDTGEVNPVAVGAGAVLGAAAPGVEAAAASKTGRAFINESIGANARDVMYGNPAKAILNEKIVAPSNGDWEAFQSALTKGATPAEAAQAAGGRMAEISNKITEIAPKLRTALSNSTQTIHVADVIDKPLNDAVQQIIDNPAMTAAEKDTAFNQLSELQLSLKHGLGSDITPLEANQIKQAIGNRINWGGNISVTDEVKPAYRAVYGSLKAAVNKAVPEAAPYNERLADLLAAQEDAARSARMEEVGAGRGMTGGSIGRNVVGRLETTAGRVIPGLSAGAPAIPVVGIPATQLDDTANLLKASGLRYDPVTRTMVRANQ